MSTTRRRRFATVTHTIVSIRSCLSRVGCPVFSQEQRKCRLHFAHVPSLPSGSSDKGNKGFAMSASSLPMVGAYINPCDFGPFQLLTSPSGTIMAATTHSTREKYYGTVGVKCPDCFGVGSNDAISLLTVSRDESQVRMNATGSPLGYTSLSLFLMMTGQRMGIDCYHHYIAIPVGKRRTGECTVQAGRQAE